jgi:Domain of unknown function (DUF4389)
MFMFGYPVQVRARRDSPPPGRWLWLVKWLLLIPHYVVLAVLWTAFAVLTVFAYIAVLITGRYPASVFDFNVGVLRWTWRVGYYGYQVLGTDRYPPFTLAEVPDYPAGLSVEPPPRRPRWMPLVAWLMALPHWLLLAGLTGTAWQVYRNDDVTVSVPGGLVTVGVLIVGVTLAVTGRHPRGLYDLLVGVARWSWRVIAYVTLLTAAYPPFRLDQGDTEPDGEPLLGTGAVLAVRPGLSRPAP